MKCKKSVVILMSMTAFSSSFAFYCVGLCVVLCFVCVFFVFMHLGFAVTTVRCVELCFWWWGYVEGLVVVCLLLKMVSMCVLDGI